MIYGLQWVKKNDKYTDETHRQIMIGLRPENDSSLRKLGAAGNKRSYKFAERLTDRFFVSGISGSFQKHHKQYVSDSCQDDKSEMKFYIRQPLLERNQISALRQEAEELLQMEEKLFEVQICNFWMRFYLILYYYW